MSSSSPAPAILVASPPDIVIVTTGVGFRGWIECRARERPGRGPLRRAGRSTVHRTRAQGSRGDPAAGFIADWVAESETSAEVGEYLAGRGGHRATYRDSAPRRGRRRLDTLLAGLGADVVSITVYRWGPPPDPQVVRRSVVQAGAGEVDAVLFTSAPGAAEWVRTAVRAGLWSRSGAEPRPGALLLAAVGADHGRPTRGCPGSPPPWPHVDAWARWCAAWSTTTRRVPPRGCTRLSARWRCAAAVC